VKRFTDTCAETGKWEGAWVEGFVVRATALDSVGDPDERLRAFMWKVKFDEPYLMWREWRETTKKMIREKEKGTKAVGVVATAKGRTHAAKGAGAGEELYGVNVERIRRKDTRLYVRWVQRALDDPDRADLFAGYNENRGIIAVRDAFYAWLESAEGQAEQARQHQRGGENWDDVGKRKAPELPGLGSLSLSDKAADRSVSDRTPEAAVSASDELPDLGALRLDDTGPFEKTLVVPIAVPGCGTVWLMGQ
jgi:tRNA ligase